MKRWAAVIIAFGLALGASPTNAASAAEATTTIVMTVSGCEGCHITPTQVGGGGSDVYNGPRSTVVGGTVSMTVPTSRTAGMYFTIEPLWTSSINAQPVIVFQYRGATPGGSVTRPQAVAAKKGSACWSGTTAASVALTVRVARVRLPGFPSGRTTAPAAWVVPTQASTGPFWPVFKGVLATQDIILCRSS